MKKTKLLTPILGLATITTIAMPLTSCGGGGGQQEDQHIVQPTTEEKTKTPEKGVVSAIYTVTLKDSLSASDINVSIKNDTSNSIFKTPTWTVNDKKCNITVEWADRPSKTQTATFTLVIKKADSSWTSEITNCKLTYTEQDVGEITVTTTTTAPYYASDEIQFTANVTPAEAPTAVTWSVDPIDVGEIDNTGKFIAKKVGTCTIKATSKTQTSKFGTKEITISSLLDLDTTTEPSEVILKGFISAVDITQDVWKTRITGELGDTLTIPANVTKIANNAFGTNSGTAKLPDSITKLDMSKATGLKSIGRNAFGYSKIGGNIVIPNNITEMNTGMFFRTNITGITFPTNANTIIPSDVCNSCTYLTSVTIPNNYTNIASSAFYCCSNLTSITLPSSLDHINDHAFYQSGLISVKIPGSVTAIDNAAFGNIDGLRTVDLSEFTTSSLVSGLTLGTSVFSEHSTAAGGKFIIANDSLNSDWQTKLNTAAGVTWGPNNWSIEICVRELFELDQGETLTLKGFVTTTTDDKINEKLGNSDTLIIPNDIETIGGHAFHKGWDDKLMPDKIEKVIFQQNSLCKVLSQQSFDECKVNQVVIPASIETIDDFAFGDCDITTVVVDSSNTHYTSRNNAGSAEINGILNADKSSLVLGTKTTDLTSFTSLTTIQNNSYRGRTGIGAQTFPSTVTYIGNSAFYGCSGLTKITIPNSVTTVGSLMLAYCSDLDEIDLTDFATVPSWTCTLAVKPFQYINSSAANRKVKVKQSLLSDWTTKLVDLGLDTTSAENNWTIEGVE